MKVFISLVVGVLIGIAAYWYFNQANHQAARDKIEQRTSEMGRSMHEVFDTQKIKEELGRTGQVIREKADQAGQAVSDAAANAKITAVVKTRLVQDSGLAAFKINVDTTDGLVTLSGTVANYDDIAHAMSIAWQVDGVHKVVSTLQLKPAASAP